MPTFARYSRNQASTWKETTEGEAWWKYPVSGVWKWSTYPWDIEKYLLRFGGFQDVFLKVCFWVQIPS